jgi:hypothetical protein
VGFVPLGEAGREDVILKRKRGSHRSEGLSIKEFVLKRTVCRSCSDDENDAMKKLEAMLYARIHRSETEGAAPEVLRTF